VSTPWDARTYDRASGPLHAWALAVLERVAGGLSTCAKVLDVGQLPTFCGVSDTSFDEDRAPQSQ
jgi:hypothetical protein